MLSKITLHNFQAHTNSVIELDEKLTVIVGANSSNKSAITKALKICCYGESFEEGDIKNGTKEGYCEVVFGNGDIIRRGRKGAEQYTQITVNGKKLPLMKGAKGAVIDEIRKVSRMHPVSLAKNSEDHLQIVETTEPRFLINNSSPETFLKKFTNLFIGSGLENVKTKFKSESRALQTKVTFADEELAKDKLQYAQFKKSVLPQLNKAKKLYDTLEELQEANDNLSEDLNFLCTELEELNRLESQVIQYDFKVLTEKVTECETSQSCLEELQDRVVYIGKFIDEFGENARTLLLLMNKLKKKDAELEQAKLEVETYRCKKCERLVQVVCE